MSGLVYFLLGSLATVLAYYFFVVQKKKTEEGYLDSLQTVSDIPTDDSVPIILLYKSEHCPACKNFVKEWKKVTEMVSKCKNRPNCMVVDVDRMGENARRVANQKNLDRVPTVMVLRKDAAPVQIEKWASADIYTEVKRILKLES